MSEALSEFIRNEIGRRGIAERELSRQANLSYGTVHYIINNPSSKPTAETCISLAHALDLPESLLLQLAGYGEIELTDRLDTEIFALATYLQNLSPTTREYVLEGCWAIARLIAQATGDHKGEG